MGDLPPYEAFPIGGTNSVRGYSEGGVGSGRNYAAGTAELHFPLVKPIQVRPRMQRAASLADCIATCVLYYVSWRGAPMHVDSREAALLLVLPSALGAACSLLACCFTCLKCMCTPSCRAHCSSIMART